MWLARVGELRLLFDPLLEDRHFGGVFDVVPGRRIDAEALRADFIVVSHRHPDHFDVASLHRLALLDAESVVVTACPLVERTAKRLGFARVQRVDALHRIDLEGARVMTTPSFGEVHEWGVMVSDGQGVVWNQVDTVFRSADDVTQILQQAAAALEQPRLTRELDLALARWQPMLEIQMTTGGAIGFPVAQYSALLAEVAALSARWLLPASAGERHAGVHAFMSPAVYPLPANRFARDVEALCPNTRVLATQMGASYRLAAGELTVEPADGKLVEVCEQPISELFRPTTFPALFDPNLDGRDEASLRARVERWVQDDLLGALDGLPASLSQDAPLTLVLEAVFPSVTDAYTFVLERGRTRVERRLEEDYDVLNSVAGSQLVDVIEGRRHWGEPLLGGLLRATHRALRVRGGQLVPLEVAMIFLYYALGYDESQERSVEHQLRELGVTSF
jgi:hypothetical protein